MENKTVLEQILTWSLAELAQSYDCQVRSQDDLEKLFSLISADLNRGIRYEYTRE